MKAYKVSYSGNATRFKNFQTEQFANSKREAAEKVYQRVLDANYFPQEDGSILDCNGELIAKPTDIVIDYDGGCFSAEEIELGNEDFSNPFNETISYLGYQIQIHEGIVYPSDDTLNKIKEMKLELKSKIEEFKEKEPYNYANSHPVEFYKKYIQPD